MMQGKIYEMLGEHISKGYNFLVITGNPRVGAPQGCKDALDVVLDKFQAESKACAGFVFTPCSSGYLEGPALRYHTHTQTNRPCALCSNIHTNRQAVASCSIPAVDPHTKFVRTTAAEDMSRPWGFATTYSTMFAKGTTVKAEADMRLDPLRCPFVGSRVNNLLFRNIASDETYLGICLKPL